MKYIFLLASLSVFLLPANNHHFTAKQSFDGQRSGGAHETLLFKYHTAKERAPDCGTRPDSECTVAEVTYPIFNNQPVLNSSVQRKLAVVFNFGDKKISTVKELLHSVIRAYLADTELVRDKGFYSLRASLKVIRQDTSMLICEIDGHTYAGGAHGGNETAFMNWDIKKQREVTLNDILTMNYLARLTGVGEKIFRKDEKLNDNASLTDDYFFKGGKFSLNDNFMITRTGIQFLYNEYEIKSFAQGQTKLFIPYSQIKSLLRPHTVTSQYLK